MCVCVRWEFPAQDNFDVQFDICLYYFVDVHVAFFLHEQKEDASQSRLW